MTGVALLGAGWVSEQYARALACLPDARLVAVASRTHKSAVALAERHGAALAVAYDDLAQLFSHPDVDVVCVNATNHLHALFAIAAARAGKHAIVEKPLCLTLAEADAMLGAARDAGTRLAYAENLCFSPPYRRARALLRDGAIGEVRWARQCEKHGGPYSDWFFARVEAGGGALLDMGCHGIECLRWLLDKPPIARVSARLRTVRHGGRTTLDDDAHVELDLPDGTRLISESSWALTGDMQSTLEVHGSDGLLHVDLLGSTGLRLYRRNQGWSHPIADDLNLNGYLPELTHFLNAFTADTDLEETAEDGRRVLELCLAAYASAGRGEPVALPYDPGPGLIRPVDLWRPPQGP